MYVLLFGLLSCIFTLHISSICIIECLCTSYFSTMYHFHGFCVLSNFLRTALLPPASEYGLLPFGTKFAYTIIVSVGPRLRTLGHDFRLAPMVTHMLSLYILSHFLVRRVYSPRNSLMTTYTVGPKEPTVLHGQSHYALTGLDLMPGFKVGFYATSSTCISSLISSLDTSRSILLMSFRDPLT